MINAVEDQIYDVSSKFPFIEKVETLLKTPSTIKIKLSITQTCFIGLSKYSKRHNKLCPCIRQSKVIWQGMRWWNMA
jgi:hypothetical protein